MESRRSPVASDTPPPPMDRSSPCNLCGRIVQSSSSDDLEIFSLCVHCKFLLLEDFGNPVSPLQTSIRTRRRRNRTRRWRIRRSISRHGSSESISDSTRWRVFSESEGEVFDNYGETESNGSFSLYRFSSSHGGGDNSNNDAVSLSSFGGGDSDVSVDRHADIFVQRDNMSDTTDFDFDIDPMHAGLNQWDSDQQEEEEEEEGEEEAGLSVVTGQGYRSYLVSPSSESYSSMTRFGSPEIESEFRQRIIERRQALSRNIFTGLEDMEFSPYSANVADYLDERGFEELLEQLAESDNSRRGAPPASVSCVRNLPSVIIGKENVEKGLVCAVCKELFGLGNETTQLPCLHLYHNRCIVPWLSARNSCPLCRYELPTDDKDYEERKQNVVDVSEENSSDDDDDDVTESGQEENVEIRERESSGMSRVSRGRWLFLAAAPVVSLVGVVLAMWLSNPQRRDMVISHSQRGNRTRRWLPFF
ncbi:unnamed protein product [Cochlearia groenlandica]